MENKTADNAKKLTESLLKAGTYFGYSKSRRHPSVKEYIYGIKGSVEIFDIEKITASLEKAKKFLADIIADGGVILLVGTKYEAKNHILHAAQEIDMPYITDRWIGGTLTNFSEIKKRVARLEDLLNKKEKGEFVKYTKKERLLLDREIEDLERKFGGIVPMKKTPNVVFVVDPRYEKTAVSEALKMNIPVVVIASSDCDISNIQYPIVANEASGRSIKIIMEDIVASLKGIPKKEN